MSVRIMPGLVTSVYDGDTVTVFADLAFDVWRYVSVRLYGCNAIELSDPGGHEARAHLMALIPIGTLVTLTSLSYDKYGARIDGKLALPDGRDVASVMIADGYAAAWDGKGPRPVPAWPIPSQGVSRD